MSLPRSRTPWNPTRWNCHGSCRPSSLRKSRIHRGSLLLQGNNASEQHPTSRPTPGEAVQRAGFRPDPSATWQGWMMGDIVPFRLTYRPRSQLT